MYNQLEEERLIIGHQQRVGKDQSRQINVISFFDKVPSWVLKGNATDIVYINLTKPPWPSHKQIR